MMIGVKGKQLSAGNPNAAGQTDGRTDGHGDSSIPPNFVAGGIKSVLPYNIHVDISHGTCSNSAL